MPVIRIPFFKGGMTIPQHKELIDIDHSDQILQAEELIESHICEAEAGSGDRKWR